MLIEKDEFTRKKVTYHNFKCTMYMALGKWFLCILECWEYFNCTIIIFVFSRKSILSRRKQKCLRTYASSKKFCMAFRTFNYWRHVIFQSAFLTSWDLSFNKKTYYFDIFGEGIYFRLSGKQYLCGRWAISKLLIVHQSSCAYCRRRPPKRYSPRECIFNKLRQGPSKYIFPSTSNLTRLFLFK